MTVVLGLPQSDPILELIVRLALQRPVQVIVGGNRFDAHRMARMMRRHSVALDAMLGRIRQARPFTCYQMVTLLAETEPSTPLVVLDMLSTFYDESVSDAESVRLVQAATGHLQRLGRQVPVLVTLRPLAEGMRPGLVEMVQAAADDVYLYRTPGGPVQLPLL